MDFIDCLLMQIPLFVVSAIIICAIRDRLSDLEDMYNVILEQRTSDGEKQTEEMSFNFERWKQNDLDICELKNLVYEHRDVLTVHNDSMKQLTLAVKDATEKVDYIKAKQKDTGQWKKMQITARGAIEDLEVKYQDMVEYVVDWKKKVAELEKQIPNIHEKIEDLDRRKTNRRICKVKKG